MTSLASWMMLWKKRSMMRSMPFFGRNDGSPSRPLPASERRHARSASDTIQAEAQCGVGPPYNAALPLHRTALPDRNAGQVLRAPVPVAPLIRTHQHRVREVVVRRALRPVGTAGETEPR